MGQTPSKRRPAPAPALAAPYGYFYGPGPGQGYVPHHSGPVLPANYVPPGGFMPHYGQMQVQMPMPMTMPQPYVWPVPPPTRKEKTRRQKTGRKRREGGVRRAVGAGRTPSSARASNAPGSAQPRPPSASFAPESVEAPGVQPPRPLRGILRRSQTPFQPSQPLDPEDERSSEEGRASGHAGSSHNRTASQSQSGASSARRPASQRDSRPEDNRNARTSQRTPSTARDSAPPRPLPSLPQDIFELPQHRETIQRLSTMPDLVRDLKAYVRTEPAEDGTKQQKKGFLHIFGSKKSAKKPERTRSLMVPVHRGRYRPTANRTSGSLPPLPASSPNNQQPSMPVPTPPSPLPGPPSPPILFNQDTEYAGLLNHSPFRVRYMNLDYPTALHLIEALKFLPDRPDIAEQIRQCDVVEDVYPLAARHAEDMRPNWSSEFLDALEEVVYLKVTQHANLRALLTSTGNARLLYNDPTDMYWGCGPAQDGDNVLGTILERVRHRLYQQHATQEA